MSRISVATIVEIVAGHFGVRVTDILSARRAAHSVIARQVAMWCARVRTEKSLPQIGMILGRDHTTVLHGVQKIDALIGSDAALAERVDEILLQIDSTEAALQSLHLRDMDLAADEIAERALSGRRTAMSITTNEVCALARAYVALRDGLPEIEPEPLPELPEELPEGLPEEVPAAPQPTQKPTPGPVRVCRNWRPARIINPPSAGQSNVTAQLLGDPPPGRCALSQQGERP